jgi:phosphatidylserine/phosphatidylglycerophosphate/cardiolipin synthase-like enzyme
VEKIHNKGVIVDGEKVLVSSINWNMNSPTFNREVGLIIEHAGLGEYYTGVFERDWRSAEKSGAPGGPDLQKIAAAGVVLSTLSLYAWVRKRKEP